MRTRRRYLEASGGIAAAGITGFAGCMESLQDESTTLRFNGGSSEDSIQGRVQQWMKEGIESRTDNVTVELYFNGELGGLGESIEKLSSGTIDMYCVVFGILSSQYRPIQIFDAPYVYEDYDHLLRATNPNRSSLAEELYGNLVDEANIRVLGCAIQGTRRLTLNDEPAHEPADLDGRRVRAIPVDIYYETVAGLGAEPVEVDWSELPTALATGSVAGQENPYNLIVSASLYEEQDYVVETNHTHAPLPIKINEDTWTSLDDDQQRAFEDATNDTIVNAVDLLQSRIEEHRTTIRDAGVEIVPPEDIDVEAFRSSVRSNIRETFPEWQDMLDELHGSSYE